ncbi:MAG: DNA polymerase ligase N-terminal domain-containing protein [Planctomycetota bacterium]|jgi:DNA ligase D-like protein (predicted 3'-phosphoesterase)
MKAEKKKITGLNRFVIQEHHATHLHWDLRLELDGVLKSWAIPKEPDRIPNKKHLAIQVEDHDLDYINFEGEIEEGHYGAGRVNIWDNGTFDLIERSENKVIFTIHGKKLKGDFCLIRFQKAGEKQWLFFKKKIKA